MDSVMAHQDALGGEGIEEEANGCKAQDMRAMLEVLLAEYGAANPDHPMTAVLNEGLERASRPVGRRGGRLGRQGG